MAPSRRSLLGAAAACLFAPSAFSALPGKLRAAEPPRQPGALPPPSASAHGQTGAVAFGLLAVSIAASASRRAATARKARVVVVEVENDVPLSLEAASAGEMDAFMAESATEVCIQNVQRVEDDEAEPGNKVCYLEPTDIGPFRSQMRLTLRVDLPEPGRCDTTILKMENGQVDKKTGEVNFPEVDATNFKFDTSNVITWKEEEGDLKLMNRCFARSETTLPGWFPVPDSLVQALSSTFVRKIISGGQEKVMDQVQLRFAAWKEERQAA